MKTLSKSLTVLTVLAFSCAPILVRAQDAPPPPEDQGDQGDQGASFQTFYDQLGDQGTWVQTDDYGYVFQPNVSDPNWAPYSDGHWVYTDEGWTWVSDEPWGWATYHYGRWANIDGTGWVWVPGYRWAPAWVSWRYGGGYCGWAPLPPETFIGAEYGDGGVSVGIGFHFGGDVDVNFNIGPGCYNFVRVGDMGERNYRGHYIDRSRNYTVINNTTNITNINVNNGVINNNGVNGANARRRGFAGVAAGGPPINEVNSRARQHIQTVQLAEANQPGKSTLQGNSLAVYAPRVNPGTVRDAKPTRVGQTINHPTFNRGDSITRPLDVTASVRPPAPSAEAIQSAQAAQKHVPAHARIATEKTVVRTPLSKPLTSLEPVAQHQRTPNAAAAEANGFNGANTVNPNVQHVQQPAANAPYTGESVKPHASSLTPQVEPKHKTSAEGNSSAEVQHTYTPGSQSSPAANGPDAQTARQQKLQAQEEARQQQAQSQQEARQRIQAQQEARQQQIQSQQESRQQSPVVHEAPTPTYHPQQQAPTQTYHPQQQVNHEAPPTHNQGTPANQPAGGNPNKKAVNDKNNPQGQ